MARYFRAAAVAVGVIGAVIVAVAMLVGPLTDDPAPGAIERFVILAYPICLFLGGLFAAIRIQAALVYGGLATLFAGINVVMALVAGDTGGGVFETVVFVMLVMGPALIFHGLCWSVMRQTGEAF